MAISGKRFPGQCKRISSNLSQGFVRVMSVDHLPRRECVEVSVEDTGSGNTQ